MMRLGSPAGGLGSGPGPRGLKESRGPGPREVMGQLLEAQGAIKAQLHGPRGDLNGVLLADGTIVRLPPPEAQRLAAQLAVRQALFVRGEGMANPLGRVIAARAIGPSQGQVTPVQALPAPGGPGGRAPGGPGTPPPPPSGAPAAR